MLVLHSEWRRSIKRWPLPSFSQASREALGLKPNLADAITCIHGEQGGVKSSSVASSMKRPNVRNCRRCHQQGCRGPGRPRARPTCLPSPSVEVSPDSHHKVASDRSSASILWSQPQGKATDRTADAVYTPCTNGRKLLRFLRSGRLQHLQNVETVHRIRFVVRIHVGEPNNRR